MEKNTTVKRKKKYFLELLAGTFSVWCVPMVSTYWVIAEDTYSDI